jgi:hypothetical protein
MKRPSFIRQPQVLGPALDQPHTEALFEFGDPPRQRSFGAAGDAGSAAEPAVGSNEVEVGQALKIHLSCSVFETGYLDIGIF